MQKEGKERDKGTEEMFETVMTEDFSKLISDTGSSENTRINAKTTKQNYT